MKANDPTGAVLLPSNDTIIEPKRVTHVDTVASMIEVTAIFSEMTLRYNSPGSDDRFEQALQVTAAVALPWAIAINLHTMLGNLIQQKQATNASGPDAKPN